MYEIKKYALTDNVKRHLGIIIREIRKIGFQESKDRYLIEKNPFTKENFCDNNNICHYHTLTKLENEIIKEDNIYHVLLAKLGFEFQVNESEHLKNMSIINKLSKDIFRAIEYIDDNLFEELRKELKKFNFKKDVIAYMHLRLIEFAYNLQHIKDIDEDNLYLMEQFIDFYKGVYKALLFQCLGIYYLNKTNYIKAKEYFLEAKDIYQENDISKGLINSYLIGVDKMTNNYLDTILLCNEMEIYYNQHNNYKRLMHVYNYLSDYYLLVNANELAEDYFNKTIEIINNNNSLERFKFTLYYNWGLRLFKEYREEEALNYFILSYENNTNTHSKIQIINMLLITLTKLHLTDDDLFRIYYHEGKLYYEYGNKYQHLIFKYFKYKLESPKYYRRFALEKIIPDLSKNKYQKEILLFFYEDLYKS